jgi:hypothetical protein
MKEYEGLKIPDREYENVSIIQEQYCYNSNGKCVGVKCSNCLFDSDNLEKFTEWFNNQTK